MFKKIIVFVCLPVIGLSVDISLISTAQAKEAIDSIIDNQQVQDLRRRQAAGKRGFEEFKRRAFKEPFENGVYIVNGDTPIADEVELREFYEREIARNWKSSKFGVELNSASVELIADAPQGKIVSWDAVTKRQITYCVSNSFGDRYEKVVASFKEAAAAWEKASNVKFEHRPWLDVLCNEKTTDVIFDVRPVNVNGQYLARAFFPRYNRPQRNVLIDESAFRIKPGKMNLVGILRHEVGHILAFRHEQTRPEAGACFEDKAWKPLTGYDGFSSMHYPQCNGMGDWSFELTEKDKLGAACLYGPPVGAYFDERQCKFN